MNEVIYLDEMKLILSCQNGEKEAFNELIRLYYPYVSKFLVKLTCNEVLSQDLIQETFVKLIRSIDNYNVKSETSFSSYLMTIARNCYIDHLRKNRKIVLSIDDFEIADKTLLEDSVHNAFQVSEIIKEIDALPYAQGQAIKMKYLEHLTLQEIAEKFSTESKTIKSRIHSGLSKLRAKLTNE